MSRGGDAADLFLHVLHVICGRAISLGCRMP